MNPVRPPVTAWRAFVDCEQIGSRYATELEACEAAKEYVETKREKGNVPAVIVVRPSYSPVNFALS